MIIHQKNQYLPTILHQKNDNSSKDEIRGTLGNLLVTRIVTTGHARRGDIIITTARATVLGQIKEDE